MLINRSKTKVMLFNTARKYDGMPKLTLSGMRGQHLEVVEQCKLLGVIIRSDMKWFDNTDYICQKGYSRMWMIRRLKLLGASIPEILDVYQKQVRSVLEMAVPVWEPALTKQERGQIERVQKCALYVILGDKYMNYEHAIDALDCETLSKRRVKLCENFTKKALKNPRYQNWFTYEVQNKPNPNTRFNATKIENVFKPVETRTDRYRDSPLPYMTEILNKLIK